MGEYVININWNGGKGNGNSKGNTTPAAFLAGAAINTLSKRKANSNVIAKSGGYIERYYEKAHEPRPAFQFFFGRKNWYEDVWEGEDTKYDEKWTKNVNLTTEITLYKRTITYTAAQALRLANLWLSTHYQYASAIASSTAELNAVNEYQNAMTGLGIVSSIAAGALVGAKVGSIAGPGGTAIGAGFGTAVATINKAVSTWNENRILNYKQAINATTSAYQLGVLGDATYGRSRQSIG